MYSMLLALVVALPNPTRFQPASYVGQLVFFRTSTVAVALGSPDGIAGIASVVLADSVVIREEDKKVCVRNLGREVWVKRSDVMTAREAVEYFTAQINEKPELSTSYVRRAKANEALNQLDESLKDYEELLRRSPTASGYWNNRGNLWVRKKEYSKAIADYEKSAELSRTSHIPLSNLGNVYVTLCEWDKAFDYFEKALAINANYSRCYASRSTAYRERKEYEKALSDAELAIKNDPHSPYGYSSRGQVRVALKQHDAALADFDEALRLDPIFASGYLYRGNLYLAKKDYQPAIRDFDRASFLVPGNAAALAGRALAWSGCGNHKLALQDADGAVKADAQFAGGHRVRAWLRATCPVAELRDAKAALEAAKKALELAKEPGGSYYETMAAALAATGDFAGAVTWQKKAIADLEYAKDKQELLQKRLKLYSEQKPFLLSE